MTAKRSGFECASRGQGWSGRGRPRRPGRTRRRGTDLEGRQRPAGRGGGQPRQWASRWWATARSELQRPVCALARAVADRTCGYCSHVLRASAVLLARAAVARTCEASRGRAQVAGRAPPPPPPGSEVNEFFSLRSEWTNEGGYCHRSTVYGQYQSDNVPSHQPGWLE